MRPAEARRGGESFESIVRRFDNTCRGIGIVLGDETPDHPKLILNARRKDEFRHSPPSSACGVGEALLPHLHLCPRPATRPIPAVAFPVLPVSPAGEAGA